MCGIWAYIGANGEVKTTDGVGGLSKSLVNRGPDSVTQVVESAGSVHLLFHRLAINGQSSAADQPFKIQDSQNNTIYIMCNGEIYNYKDIATEYNITLNTGSDCEVLCELFDRFWATPKMIFQRIKGEFAIVAVRVSPNGAKSVIAGRDPYGVRPLYWSRQQDSVIFSSLLSGIVSMEGGVGNHFPPGQYVQYDTNTVNQRITYPVPLSYYTLPMINMDFETTTQYAMIANSLVHAISIRTIDMCDRPGGIGFLLSGGLDSSLIVGIASRVLNIPKPKTFSVGMEGSKDLIYARKVADYLETDHTEVIFTIEEAIAAIPEVIRCLETYDITTIRASIGSYLLAKWIKNNTYVRVLLNGDGSDEVACGYLYNYYAPSPQDANDDALRLLREIHMYDGLRVDRTIAYNGIEARVPFLDPEYVGTYLSMPVEQRVPNRENNRMEKQLLRDAFNTVYPGILPDEILYRRKEAFSDGVSAVKSKRTMIESIKEWACNQEPERYKAIFEEMFPGHLHVIPRYWMPRWTGNETNDPSATTLKIY